MDTAEELRKIGRDAAYPLSGNYVLTADVDLSGAEGDAIGGSNTNPDGGSNENPDTSDRVALGSFASFVLAILTAVGVVTFRRKKRI